MERPSLFAVVVLLVSAFLAACSVEPEPTPRLETPSTAAPPQRYRPSAPVPVILIVIDTLRADAVFDPSNHYDTPNLDRLAHEGVAFPRTFASAPMTLPSHMSLFSSRPPFETKVLNNGQEVPGELPLVAEWMQHAGYDTRAVISLGTLNCAEKDEHTSARRGFASYEHDRGYMSRAEDTEGRLRASLAARDAQKPLFLFAHFADPHEPYDAHSSDRVEVGVTHNGKHLASLLASEAQAWTGTAELPSGRSVFEFSVPNELGRRFRVRQFECLEEGKALPFEFEAGKLMDRLKSAIVVVDRGDRPSATGSLRLWVNDVPRTNDAIRQRYALEVGYVDRFIGLLLAELERLGLYQESLIVFTSDHGEALGERKVFGHVEGLTYEHLHVPLIVKLPASDPRRAELERSAAGLTSHLDLVPTMLDVAGLPPLPGQRGQSLLEPHETVHVSETHRPEAKKNQVALRDARFNLVYYPDEERFVLYDLVQDPEETTDVFQALGSERADWPTRLRWIYQQSQARFSGETGPVDDEGHEAMLRALGYAE